MDPVPDGRPPLGYPVPVPSVSVVRPVLIGVGCT